jgi:predicted GNAT superfamily acetyltransferase
MKKSNGIVIRDLESPEEFRETEVISRLAWQFSDLAISPVSDLIAGSHSGGLTAGVFEGKQMLGFVHGIPRVNQGKPCQHSHLLAVHPQAQGKGLSIRLKLYQREWCLARGIRLVTWTYDPFFLTNARLNLARLRATVRTFLPNFYGNMGGIYGELPTDRFEVIWRLDDPLVERAARGEESPVVREEEKLPIATTSGSIPSGPHVAVMFPAGAPGIYQTDPAFSLKERRRFARIMPHLLERGYEVTGVTLLRKGPAYVLEHR